MWLLRSTAGIVSVALICSLCDMSAAQDPHARVREMHSPASMGLLTVPVSPGDWSEAAKLTGKSFTLTLGESVAISGRTVVVGESPVGLQLAFVYEGSPTGWNSTLPVATLAQPTSSVVLNAIVAIDGDTIVVGTPAFESGNGYAYVYVKPPGGWRNMYPTAILTPSGANDGWFGTSVAISGDTIVVGDTSYDISGTAYVYAKPSGGWTNMTETARLTATDEEQTSEFSETVAVSGDTIAVGSPGAARGTGAAYVFVEPPAGWTTMTQTAKLGATDALADARIGNSIAFDGDNILAGAPNPGTSLPGEAYIFTKPSAGWKNMTQTAELSAADGIAGNFFGGAVSISGNLAIVGAPDRGAAPYTSLGGIYIFQEPAGGGWQNMASSTVVTASDAHLYSEMGMAVSISGKTFVAGSNRQVPNAAYVFGLP